MPNFHLLLSLDYDARLLDNVAVTPQTPVHTPSRSVIHTCNHKCTQLRYRDRQLADMGSLRAHIGTVECIATRANQTMECQPAYAHR